MKIIAWNCQGLGKPKAVRALKALLVESKPDILFLSEIKTSSFVKLVRTLSSVQLHHHSIVPPIGLAGGICLAWADSVNISISSLDSWFINASVSFDPNCPSFQFTGCYCPSPPALKPIFWSSIRDLAAAFDGPWLLMGDFNDITAQNEKKGGQPFVSSSHNPLTSDINFLNLVDLGFHGHPFTWNNQRSFI